MNFTIAAHVVYNKSYISHRWWRESPAQEFEQFFVWNWRFGIAAKEKGFKTKWEKCYQQNTKSTYTTYILLISYLYVFQVARKKLQT